jgi:hypothetical protein
MKRLLMQTESEYTIDDVLSYIPAKHIHNVEIIDSESNVVSVTVDSTFDIQPLEDSGMISYLHSETINDVHVDIDCSVMDYAFPVYVDTFTRVPTTVDEHDGKRGVTFKYPLVILPPGERYMQAVCNQDSMPLEIKGTSHSIMNDADIVLYLHPSDVQHNGDCRIYDYMYRELGVVSTDSLLYPAIHYLPSDDNDRFIPHFTKRVVFVYSNPRSKVVLQKLIHGARVIKSSQIGGRVLVYIETYALQWKSIGWVDVEDIVHRQTEPGFHSAIVTLPGYLAAKYPTEQHNAQEVFELTYKNSFMPIICRKNNYVMCNGHDFVKTSSRVQNQPFPVTLSKSDPHGFSIQSLLQRTLSGYGTEYDIEKIRACDNMPGSRKEAMSPTRVHPGMVTITVAREVLVRDMYGHAGKKTLVQDIKVCPSVTIDLFGIEYRLVSFIAKLGPYDHGHWVSYVHTDDHKWYLFDDNKPPMQIESIGAIGNGVVFIYQQASYPLLSLDPHGTLPNSRNLCWANSFSQAIRYSSAVGESIGVIGRLSTFSELLSVVDMDAQFIS